MADLDMHVSHLYDDVCWIYGLFQVIKHENSWFGLEKKPKTQEETQTELLGIKTLRFVRMTECTTPFVSIKIW